MKIYGIFNGEYSDWNVLGYYTTREEAEKRCAIKNEEYRYSEEYVIELDCLDGTVKTTENKLYYLHEVVFDKEEEGWIMRNEPTRYRYSVNEMPEKEIREGRFGIMIYVKSRQGAEGRAKVEKIAQDRLYKHLALKKGIL